MRVIFICCFGGRSSRFLCTRIKALVSDDVYCDSIHEVIKHYDELSQTVKLVIAYGSLSLMDPYHVRKKDLGNKMTQIWICPQAAYMQDRIAAAMQGYGIPLHVLDAHTFGTMDAYKVWQDIQQAL